MRSRVFVSCGQQPHERELARKIGKLLVERGFDVYIAIDVQTILEINTGIIQELKNSDCYLFINFRRERIGFGLKTGRQYRGSLFSNQELAIAYALNFERILVINQEGILPEGMLKYIGINTETFVGTEDCCATVKRALDRSGWSTNYSRRLRADGLRFSDPNLQYGHLVGRFLYIDIHNGRPDIAALEATAKCSGFAKAGKALGPCPIGSPLKATARPGFAHTIFPSSHEAFDILCVGFHLKQAQLSQTAPAASGSIVGPQMLQWTQGVFLNSALDSVDGHRLDITPGVWEIRYEFFAVNFGVLSVSIELTLSDSYEPGVRLLDQKVI
ncbi:MAG: hypothetical protein ACLQKA_23645 [Bryobacteraceae bacterium]